jgi:metallo-beta-lactamase class B
MKPWPIITALLALALGQAGCTNAAETKARERADASPPSIAALRAQFPSWYEPAEPFRVIGPIHSVGSRGLSIFFIPTPEGHLVIDGGLPETAAIAADNIRALGYDPADIRILLNTHAHFDHSGGLAELKALSGARLYAHEGDRSALEGGFYLGFEDRPLFNAPPVAVDQTVADGEAVRLGDVTLTAQHTPGHTRGCTSWKLTVEEHGKPYTVLVFCSASVAANRLTGPPQYPGIVDDYRRTFERVRDWQPDVFLSNHAEFYELPAKRKRQQAGDALAFVKPGEFEVFIRRAEADFKAALQAQGSES